MMNDAALVGLALSQPQQGVAAIYERYGTSLYNYCHSILRSEADAGDALQDSFLTVMSKLRQLREPDKLRPWLYAIARNECFKRHRARKRERPEDPFETDEEQTVMAAPADRTPGAELVAMVWEATAGLSEVDRSVLELNIRHELDGEELAASLGVPGPKCSVMLHRAKERLRTAIGALIVSKVGAEVCGDLSGIVAGNEFSPLIRKRVARHITSCAVCEETERRHRPEAYLAVVPLLRIPADVHKRVIETIHSATAAGAGSESGSGSGADAAGRGDGSGADAAGRGDGSGAGGPRGPHWPAEVGAGTVDATVWNDAGFPIPPDGGVGDGRGRVPSRLRIAAVAVGCVVALVVLLALLNPFEDRTTVVAVAAPSLEPTALPRPAFEPTEPPAPPTSAPPTSTARPQPTRRPENPVATAATATPTVTVAPVAPVAPTVGSAPATATAIPPSPTATPTPSPTVTPSPTATAPPPTPTSTPPGPTPTGAPPLTPPFNQQAPTSGEIFVDFTAPSVTSFTVDCGDPFVLRVTVGDAGDPDPTVDLDVTWDDESDPAIPLTRESGNTYRADVPRSELDNERIDFFVRGFLQDASGNTRLVDLDDDCTIIG